MFTLHKVSRLWRTRAELSGHEAGLAMAAQPKTSLPVFVHVHVPKCGGTTVNVLLERWFGKGYECWYSKIPEHAWSLSEMEAFVAARPYLRCFASHEVREFPQVLAGRPALYFTFLREPADRLVSCAKHLLRERGTLSSDFERYLPAKSTAPDLPEVLRGWIDTAIGPNRKTHVEASSLARFFFHNSWVALEHSGQVTPSLGKLDRREDYDDQLAFALALAELRRFFFVGDFAHFQREMVRLAGSLRAFGISADVGVVPHERRSTKGGFASKAEEAEIRRGFRAVLPIDVALYETLAARQVH
jgi:hypothetical protein